MDADLQHPPELIAPMFELWQAGAPVVNAVKQRRQQAAFHRHLGALLFYAMFRRATGMDLERDSDYKLFDRSVANSLLRFPERVRFFRGLSRSLGYLQVDVEFAPQTGTRAHSNFTTRQLLQFAMRAIVSFSARPLRWLATLGAAVALVVMVLAAQTLYLKFTGRAAEGFPTVILLILGSTALQLLGFGVICEYLAAIYEEGKQRPHYLVSKVCVKSNQQETS